MNESWPRPEDIEVLSEAVTLLSPYSMSPEPSSSLGFAGVVNQFRARGLLSIVCEPMQWDL